MADDAKAENPNLKSTSVENTYELMLEKLNGILRTRVKPRFTSDDLNKLSPLEQIKHVAAFAFMKAQTSSKRDAANRASDGVLFIVELAAQIKNRDWTAKVLAPGAATIKKPTR
jgi:hypothetical protein